MIKNNKIEIIVYNKELSHYRQFFPDIKSKDKILIDLNMLKPESKKNIEVICDFCGTEKNINYCDYRRITNNFTTKYYCKKCKWNKTKQTNLEKYGVENPFQNEEIKNKIKKTNLEKFGVEYPLQNEEIKKKRRETELEKYGFDHHLKNETILNKLKKTNLERYGNECSLLNDEVRLKTIKTNIERYGVDVPLKNKEIIDKLITTNNSRYDNNSPLQNEDIRKKSLKTLFENFGVYNPLKSEIIKNKVKDTKINNLLKKYKELNIINIDYNNQMYEFKCDCKNDHNFLISSSLLYNRLKIKTKICTICNKINSYNNSGLQIQLIEFIKEKYDKEINLNDRKIIYPNELDIYLPDLKLGFEFNGVFWHNEMGRDNNYHLMKTEMCEKKGVQLIHIFEDDWIYKQEIVKSKILNLLGKTPNKINSTNICEITDNSIVRDFLNNNHLQGYIDSQIKIGLFYKNELISLMVFSKHNDGFEMLRFCNKLNTSVVEGSDKLFKYFIDTYHPIEVIIYDDRSWSQGELYKALGFVYVGNTPPDYYYVINGIRETRFNYHKDKLVKEGFDDNLSEHDIMLARKIYRIYDCGNLKFEFKS